MVGYAIKKLMMICLASIWVFDEGLHVHSFSVMMLMTNNCKDGGDDIDDAIDDDIDDDDDDDDA